MSRRDWVYLLSLLVPFVVYNLALKAVGVVSRTSDPGLVPILDLLRSDVFFNLGYVLLWIGLFAATRGRGPLRWAVVLLFHVSTMLVALVTTCAYQYYRLNGTTLDYAVIAEWLPKLEELVPIFARDVPLFAWILLAAALLYAALGPWLVTRAATRPVGRRDRRMSRMSSPAVTPGIFFLGSLVLFAMASVFGYLSLLTGTTTTARDPVINVILTGYEEATEEMAYSDTSMTGEHPAAYARLAQTHQTEQRNVVLIHLESTRAQSVTPYNEDLKTTPFLDELAESSLLAERAYTTVPRSSKASVSVNCGVEPPLFPGPEFEPGGIPAPCLAGLLRDQGYRTVFFASTSNAMDNFDAVARGFGYEEIYSSEVMDRESFQVTNTFGYEEDIMLEPSREWLKAHKNEPFMAEYFTGTGHYGYECMNTRYGVEAFAEDEELNRYLNCLRLQDIFLQNLFEQYKDLGLYENTIFVIFGDHGEGFKEHGRDMHGDTIWDEGLKVPLVIHDPQRFQSGERVEGLSSQLDILPTVVEMLGYEVENGEYPGYSLLHSLPEDRILRFSCISSRKCLASIRGYEKYIYHYDDLPEEVFDLSEDPMEKNNLADERSEEELNERREDLLAWRSRVNAVYSGPANFR